MREAWTQQDWRKAVVYGLGISGRAAIRLLREHGVAVIGVDDRTRGDVDLGGLNLAGVELRFGAEAGSLPAEVDGVVVSPGVPPERPLLVAARRRGVPILAEVELAFPLLDGPVIGITGSNGKSTTTALTGALLKAAGRRIEVCGNIGRALSDVVSGPASRVFVVELSSFQLENLHTFRPAAVAYLNLAADHLDRYAGLDEYNAAKRNLLAAMDPGGVAVLNADDPRVAVAPAPGRRRFFSRLEGIEDGCFLEGDRVIEVEPGVAGRELFTRRDLPLAGEHNLENAMAASLLARAVGAEAGEIRTGLRGFRVLPHRMEKVEKSGRVLWLDDSKGTNPAATARSLEGLPDGAVHLILGGRNKGADLRELAPLVRRKVRRLYLIGEAAEELESALAGTVSMERNGTLERAVESAARRAEAGEVVLLSPACASFDQFRSFAERGERFQQLVERVGG